MKKIFILLTLITALFSMNVSPISANNTESAELISTNTNHSILLPSAKENYFEFTSGNSRINSDGSFTFSFAYGTLHSTTIRPSGSSLQVNITATCTDHEDCYYYVALMKGNYSVESGTLVKRVKYYTDGNEWGYTFTGLTAGSDYYLDFSQKSGCNGCIDGEGQVIGIQ